MSGLEYSGNCFWQEKNTGSKPCLSLIMWQKIKVAEFTGANGAEQAKLVGHQLEDLGYSSIHIVAVPAIAGNSPPVTNLTNAIEAREDKFAHKPTTAPGTTSDPVPLLNTAAGKLPAWRVVAQEDGMTRIVLMEIGDLLGVVSTAVFLAFGLLGVLRAKANGITNLSDILQVCCYTISGPALLCLLILPLPLWSKMRMGLHGI